VPNVRTTIQPGTIQKVTEQEFTDLSRQGLILEVVTSQPVPVKTAPKIKIVSNAEKSKAK
jgi:hypothetical protein